MKDALELWKEKFLKALFPAQGSGMGEPSNMNKGPKVGLEDD